MPRRLGPDWRPFVPGALALVCGVSFSFSFSLAASALRNADTAPPVLGAATLSAKPDGNGNWRRTPVELTLSATDDVAVAKLQYSIDGGATYLDAPVPSPAASATVRVTISQQGNTLVRYRAIDSAGNFSIGETAAAPAAGRGGGRGGRGGGGGGAGAQTLAVSAAAGATGIRLTSTDGRTSGEKLFLGSGANQESVTIARLVTEPADAAAPNVILDAPLTKAHALPADAAVFTTYRTIAVQIDNLPPLADWPAVVDGAIMQSQTLTPVLTDPRRQTPADTAANGSGGVGIWRMEMDGAHVFPFPQTLNTFTTGPHTQTLALQDAAGNAINYTRPFLVTTSFADLDAVLTQYAAKALSTTLGTPAAAGDSGLRLASPIGFRAGQTLVIGTGAAQETMTIARVPSPPPQSGANVILASAVTQAHAAATPVTNPRPVISSATETKLRALLKQASDAATAKQTAGAIAALRQFNLAVTTGVTPAAAKNAERAALRSAGQTLIDQLEGRPLETHRPPVKSSPGTSIIRIFTDPTPPVRNAKATYKVLVNGQTNGAFRHEHIVDTEAMIQKLGAANGFDVDIWDKPTGPGAPGRAAPPGVSLETSPFLDLNKLREYKTLVFNSTVGRGATASLNAAEFENLQAYIRGGGGIVFIHGGIDAYQDVPWFTDLDGAGFSGHGSNAAGIMPDCGACVEVELITNDPSHPATKHLAPRFATHDELYNTTRNPVELGLVHPLVFENEATIIGQINATTGPIMNSDRHAMVWCRNFDGGRSFTSAIGHSWALMHESWYQQMILGGIQSTAGVVSANCVTYNEVSDLLSSSAAADNTLRQLLASARAEYERGRPAQAVPFLDSFVKQTTGTLRTKGIELSNWMKALSTASERSRASRANGAGRRGPRE